MSADTDSGTFNWYSPFFAIHSLQIVGWFLLCWNKLKGRIKEVAPQWRQLFEIVYCHACVLLIHIWAAAIVIPHITSVDFTLVCFFSRRKKCSILSWPGDGDPMGANGIWKKREKKHIQFKTIDQFTLHDSEDDDDDASSGRHSAPLTLAFSVFEWKRNDLMKNIVHRRLCVHLI